MYCPVQYSILYVSSVSGTKLPEHGHEAEEQNVCGFIIADIRVIILQ